MLAEWLLIERWYAGRLPENEVNEMRERAHQKTAQVSLKLIRHQGGIFVKV